MKNLAQRSLRILEAKEKKPKIDRLHGFGSGPDSLDNPPKEETPKKSSKKRAGPKPKPVVKSKPSKPLTDDNYFIKGGGQVDPDWDHGYKKQKFQGYYIHPGDYVASQPEPTPVAVPIQSPPHLSDWDVLRSAPELEKIHRAVSWIKNYAHSLFGKSPVDTIKK